MLCAQANILGLVFLTPDLFTLWNRRHVVGVQNT